MAATLTNGIFAIALLAGSATCVVASLWLAQCLSLDRRFLGSSISASSQRIRAILGATALAISVAMLLGFFPGNFLNPWTAFAALGMALLSMVTIATSISAPQIEAPQATSEFESDSYSLRQPTTAQSQSRKAA
jgi:hypothetical protein